MPFTLDNIVPWGRSYSEYKRMFALTDGDLGGTIISCADGPASFNAEASKRGCRIVSVDPIYGFSAEEIHQQMEATSPEMAEQTRKNQAEFIWKEFKSVEDLVQARMNAMRVFLADYEIGLSEGRYVQAELPALPFSDDSFNLALCSHFLFLYSHHLSEEFHLKAIREMCRVAKEVRIFPLVALGSGKSNYVDSVTNILEQTGLKIEIVRVPYEFKRGGNQMMRIRTDSGKEY